MRPTLSPRDQIGSASFTNGACYGRETAGRVNRRCVLPVVPGVLRFDGERSARSLSIGQQIGSRHCVSRRKRLRFGLLLTLQPTSGVTHRAPTRRMRAAECRTTREVAIRTLARPFQLRTPAGADASAGGAASLRLAVRRSRNCIAVEANKIGQPKA